MASSQELISAAVQRPTKANMEALQQLCGKRSFAERKEMETSGLVAALVEIIKKRHEYDEEITNESFTMAWDMLSMFVKIDNLDDTREYGQGSPSQVCFTLGVLDYCVEELVANYDNCKPVLRFIRWVAEDPAYIPRLVELGVHVEAVKHIRDDDSRGSTSMSLLRTFAALEGNTRAKLREDGVLDHVLPLVDRLKPDNVGVERVGFNAASIVSRLAGNDEAGGMGSKMLHGNPLIVQSLIAFLNGAVDGGAQGDFLNMKINPHFITMDILIIAASDANKPLLAPAIEIMFKAVKLRSSNVKMVHDITNILLLLSFDSTCLAELQRQGKTKFALLGTAIPLTDKQERMAFENLMLKVFPQHKPTAAAVETTTGRFRGLLKSGGSSTKRKSETNSKPKHVMISYNWGSKPLVLHVNEMLNQSGVKTWIDVRDMGGNIVDSMAHAVENAYYLVAFVTAAYKESGNCRRECEYADTFGVPIVYVMAQPEYKPNGWLAMQMGKSLYVEITTLEQANERVSQITARVTNTAAPVQTPIAASSGDTNVLLKALMDKLMSMEEELKSANTKLGSMEQEIFELKSLLLKRE